MFKRIDKILGRLFADTENSFLRKHMRKISVYVVAALVFAMIFKGLMQIPQIKENRRRIEELKASIEYEKLRQEEIDELKNEVDTDEYIEKIAGDKLGLVKSNAKIFVDVSE